MVRCVMMSWTKLLCAFLFLTVLLHENEIYFQTRTPLLRSNLFCSTHSLNDMIYLAFDWMNRTLNMFFRFTRDFQFNRDYHFFHCQRWSHKKVFPEKKDDLIHFLMRKIQAKYLQHTLFEEKVNKWKGVSSSSRCTHHVKQKYNVRTTNVLSQKSPRR